MGAGEAVVSDGAAVWGVAGVGKAVAMGAGEAVGSDGAADGV